VARLKPATATSAGGIVIEVIDGAPHLVAGHRRRDRSGTWTLPKGTPNPGEPLEATALREVGEETGLTVCIVAPLEAIEYWFVQSGMRVHKTVHYWLMETTGGDLARHDHEFDEVRWVAVDQASSLLTFPTERALVERAAALHASLAERRDRPGASLAVAEGGRA
jgi:8-oxo-dGTP pyrophosphatase MutT (NUDIX family)